MLGHPFFAADLYPVSGEPVSPSQAEQDPPGSPGQSCFLKLGLPSQATLGAGPHPHPAPLASRAETGM